VDTVLRERYLDAFFTAAPAGLAIIDRDLRYARLNDTLAQMNGLAREAHIGRSVREVLPELASTLEPILRRILTTGEPALNIEVNGETPAEPGVRRYWLASYFPLPGADGVPDGVGAIVVEDTARRRAEQARRRSGAEYRAIVENAAYGIYRSSFDGRFLKVNPALVRMLGYGSETEVLGLDLARDVYLNPDQRNQLIAQFRTAEQIQGAEAEWKRKDGHRIVVRLSGRPVQSERGDLLGFEMMAEDVTEQRALEHALRQAQKMETIGQLASGIAHDFNNLLTVILAHARLLKDAVPADQPDMRRDLDAVHEAARHGAELVHKVLGFSRREKLDLQPLSLAEYLQETVETLRRVLPATVEVEFAATEDAVVEADPGAVQQILLNLGTNARDAMPDGGTLHIELRRTRLDAEDRPLHAWVAPGSYACIAVSDTGVGMDQATLARVLEPFFTTKPPGVGTGLGMAMVYGLVKQHKGFVHLYSEQGQGTTVKVYFPLVYRAAPRPAAQAPEDSLPGGNEAILLAEDDPTLRRVAERLLGKVGYRVLSARDGAEALSVWGRRRAEIALVITDMIMPKATGFDLYEAVRRHGATVPVLFTSGYAAPSYRKTVAGDERVAFVTKPWTVSDLLLQVRTMLDGGGAVRV
jgi:two-component system cell cycle sensor histidine kinase/response regulator CckA